MPVFVEQERNDEPFNANHFGVIRPGDHFFIDGFVRDDLVDPFDGFAFTAGSPLHVDFQLWSGRAAADLDVCLYDPQLDETLACYATDLNPEIGGVDVSAGGFDFHLVVEAFVGDSSYSLEIVVLPLFAATADDGLTVRESPANVRGVGDLALRAPRAAQEYRAKRAAYRPLAVVEEHLWLDEKNGFLLGVRSRLR